MRGISLAKLPLVGNAWGNHFIDPAVDFAQLGSKLFALVALGPPAIGRTLDEFKQVKGDLARHIHDLEP